MPDLNIANPRVRDEINKIVGYWLELGLSGFRVDAAPFVIEQTDTEAERLQDPHAFLRDLRAFLNRRRGDAILLAEANLPPEDQRRFFGDEGGDEMHMLFNFLLNQRLFLALVRQDPAPVVTGLRELPPVPDTNQWANFVKNHDELTLDKLTEAEREEVFAALAPDPEMRSFGRGIRRRVPPMLDGDRDRIELLYSLLFTLPGTPVLLYGEEIGLGDDPRVEGRGAVRVAMQWSPGPNAGFTTGDPAVPVVTEGPFGPDRVNVATQRRDPESLPNWMERAIRTRKELPELGWGAWRVLDTDQPSVLAHRCDWQGKGVLVLHNLGPERVKVTIELGDDVEAGRPMPDLLGNRHHDPATTGQPLSWAASATAGSGCPADRAGRCRRRWGARVRGR
jgi:maltose alpha-D-glucosyltransferase/alpha-amylase